MDIDGSAENPMALASTVLLGFPKMCVQDNEAIPLGKVACTGDLRTLVMPIRFLVLFRLGPCFLERKHGPCQANARLKSREGFSQL